MSMEILRILKGVSMLVLVSNSVLPTVLRPVARLGFLRGEHGKSDERHTVYLRWLGLIGRH